MSQPQPIPGNRYRLTVASADQAAAVIRAQLGPDARVLSVRSLPASGLKRLWASPQLEVIAEIPAPLTLASAEPTAPAISETPATPTDRPSTNSLASAYASSAAATNSEANANAGATAANSSPSSTPRVSELLRRVGFSESALSRLFNRDHDFGDFLPLPRALAQVEARLRRTFESRENITPLTRAAFIGPAGCGRTTALCKWLGREVFRRARAGHVVVAEFEQPNPAGTLPVFCEALGVPVAHFPASLEPAAPEAFVYVDLPAFSLRDPAANRPLAEFLEREKITQRVLVLNAAYDHSTLRDAYATGRALGATHVVFTHLDEIRHWARLWDYLADDALTPLFLATGPSLTGDCVEEVADAVVTQTFAGLPHTASASTAQRSAA